MLLLELVLLWTKTQFVLYKDLQHSLDSLSILFDSPSEDQDIVQVYYYNIFYNEISEYIVYHCLENSWTVSHVIELYQDYNYYQPQTDNKQMVEKMIAIRDEKDKDNAINNISAYQGQNFRLNCTNYRHWTKGEMLDKPWGNYRQILLQL